MLKAVCLDEREHAHLLKFLDEYRDETNKQNASSAIRFLMQLGYETLYGKKTVQIPYNKSKINKDEIKKELKSEVMHELNTELMSNLTKAINNLGNLQITSVPNTSNTSAIDKPREKKENTRKQVKLPSNVEAGSLLANILGNAQR